MIAKTCYRCRKLFKRWMKETRGLRTLFRSFHELTGLMGLPLFAMTLLFGSGCNAEKKKVDLSGEARDNYIKAKPAPEWQGMLTRYHGWIGADGVYAVAMNGVETPGSADSTHTFFWFSDTILGDIVDDSLHNWDMVNNSVGFMQGGTPDPANMKMNVRYDDKGKPLSVFSPQTPQTKEGEYYWLGDGVFNHSLDSTIYIFAYKIVNVPGSPFPFKQTGVSLIAIPRISKFPFTDQRQMDTPLFIEDSAGVTFYGASLLPNTVGARAPNPDGFIYVYGVRSGSLVVARVKDISFEDFSQWTYWDGKAWNLDKHKAAALTRQVSNEMSVSFMEDGRVIAIYQREGNSPDIMMQIGITPTGPFYPAKKIYETPEVYQDVDFYTYNAKGYPHLSKPGELLISYNVNAFDFEKKFPRYPHHLRPRFITVKYK